jgi:hypothetical protein
LLASARACRNSAPPPCRSRADQAASNLFLDQQLHQQVGGAIVGNGVICGQARFEERESPLACGGAAELAQPLVQIATGRPLEGAPQVLLGIALAAGVAILDGRFLDFLDPWGNRVEIVGYDNIQFTKAPNVLRGMGLTRLAKNENARKELAQKGMAID